MRPGHPHEYPIIRLWYTKHAGDTIERIIDTDIQYFEWMVNTFQMVTPDQARYYEQHKHKKIPDEYIMDAPPYEWRRGDPERLYIELCHTRDLEGTLLKYRGEQLNIFT